MASKSDKVTTSPLSGVKIKCENKEALFSPSKLGKHRKTISKCIKFGAKWVNPNEFESIAGSHARKWKQSIRCEEIIIINDNIFK